MDIIKLEDVQKNVLHSVPISFRITKAELKFMQKNKIDRRKLVLNALKQLGYKEK